MKVKQHCRKIDTSNQQILQLLPPGATLPPYLEQDRNEALYPKKDEKKKKKKGNNSDSSSSSEDSDDDDDDYAAMNKSPSRPGTIDNSSLILPTNNEGWCCTIESTQNDPHNNDDKKEWDDDAILLQNHLVRGYHYELLPREAYVALRNWYGESSPPITRRVVMKAADAAGTQRVKLYSEHWDVFTRQSSSLSSSGSNNNGNTSYKCSACGSPAASSSCTRCGVAKYCNKDCQRTHWAYHKKMCPGLKEKKEKGKLDVNALDSAWGRVGLNNLGNTCFMNSAVQVSLYT